MCMCANVGVYSGNLEHCKRGYYCLSHPKGNLKYPNKLFLYMYVRTCILNKISWIS